MKISKTIGRLTLVLEGRDVGGDLLVTLTGGKAHIGAAALAYSDAETKEATVTVLSVPGHKEEEIARYGAERMSSTCGKTVLFAAGIHLDEISSAEIKEIEQTCFEMIQNSLPHLN